MIEKLHTGTIKTYTHSHNDVVEGLMKDIIRELGGIRAELEKLNKWKAAGA